MTRDELRDLVLEAGIDWHKHWNDDGSNSLEHLATLIAALATAAEREAIVKKDLTVNSAYKERNQLVALLSTCFPAGKAKTSIEGWDEAWHGCVYIDFPWGQASWHYHESDEWMFEHLPTYQKQWDGHTTEQKYSAIAQAIRARGKA